MASPRTTALGRGLALSLEALHLPGQARAHDGLADPGGARAALDAATAGTKVLLRALPALAKGPEGYGPDPRDPFWVLLEGDSRDVRVVPCCDGKPAGARAARVVIEGATVRCCDAQTCGLDKIRVSAWLELEPGAGRGRLLVAEAVAATRAEAAGAARGVGEALARATGIPIEPESEEADEPPPPVTQEDPTGLPAASLARFAVRAEGVGVVLRDHASAGPRARVRRLVVAGAVLTALALPLWWLAGRSAMSGASLGPLLGFGAVASLLTLAAYAFFGVARFAARYGASSAPLLWLGSDRLTAMPWVSRRGAVDLRPEGRFGASIPLGELRGAAVRARDGRHVVELDTDHGAIDVLAVDDAAVAGFWREVIQRAAKNAAHPEVKVSARQRARQRAAGR